MRGCTAIVGWSIVATIVALGATGCVGERDFPNPNQMCEHLVEACGDTVLLENESSISRKCYNAGIAGQKDRTKEAQCFAVYDECINDCEFWTYYLTLDGGADSSADSSSVDAASDLDAAANEPDAPTVRDE